METVNQPTTELELAREDFIRQWGAMGSAWGINRTMAMIHALLMTNPVPMTTDQIMEELQVSRGNANANLRELVGWGLLRPVAVKGERKDFYEAEKDVWKIFCSITRERKRREIEPALAVLEHCAARTKDIEGEQAKQFCKMMQDLGDFVSAASSVMDKVSRSERSKVVPATLKLFGQNDKFFKE
ncbi:MAG: transcriptional regulator [Verrucomicrobiota bacterium]